MNELQSLIEKCRNNDRKAHFELYKWGFPDLMRMAMRYKKNKEDGAALVNAAFFKAFTNIDKYKNEIPFEGWLKKIMRNTIIDEYRKTNKQKEIDLEFSIDENENDYNEIKAVDYNLIEKEMSSEEAEKILFSLEENERTVFNLFEMDGYSHKEIAVEMGISERTSKRYLSSAKRNLQTRLKGILNSVLILI